MKSSASEPGLRQTPHRDTINSELFGPTSEMWPLRIVFRRTRVHLRNFRYTLNYYGTFLISNYASKLVLLQKLFNHAVILDRPHTEHKFRIVLSRIRNVATSDRLPMHTGGSFQGFEKSSENLEILRNVPDTNSRS